MYLREKKIYLFLCHFEKIINKCEDSNYATRIFEIYLKQEIRRGWKCRGFAYARE